MLSLNPLKKSEKPILIMCLRIQFGIYQWVRTFNFLKKSQNRCSLMLSQLSQFLHVQLC
jgi:hypothetical protein